MNLPYLQLTPNELRFIGEGNENLVFSLIGTGCVLRMKKTPLSKDYAIAEDEFWAKLQIDLNFINFSRYLVSPLLVNRSYPVAVDPKVIKAVLNNVRRLRDGKRLNKEGNPFGVGILFVDATVVFCNRGTFVKHKSNPLVESNHLNFSHSSSGYGTTLEATQIPSFNKMGKCNCKLDPLVSSNLGDIPRKSELFFECCGSPDLTCSTRKWRSTVVDPTLRLYTRMESTFPISLGDKLFQVTQDDLLSFRFLKNPANADSSNPNLKSICIELKPKQGYKELTPSGKKICRFCLKQFIKLKKGSESSRSLYCPLDLFSGDRKLMKKAVGDLFTTPQNNLRIFVEGVATKNISKYKYLSDLIIEILLYELFKPIKDSTQSPKEEINESKETNSPLKENSIDFEKEPHDNYFVNSPNSAFSDPRIYNRGFKNRPKTDPKLSHHSILGKILLLQSFSKIYEFEAAVLMKSLQLHTGIENISGKILQDIDHILSKGCIEYKNELKSGVRKQSLDQSSKRACFINSYKTGKDIDILDPIPTLNPVIESLHESLVALSVKDVSLMLLVRGPFEKLPATQSHESPFWLPFRGGWYKCQVTVVDLALKYPSKLLDHGKSIAQMEQILAELETKPSCCS